MLRRFSRKPSADILYVVPPPEPANQRAPSLRFFAFGAEKRSMSTTLAWVWGVW